MDKGVFFSQRKKSTDFVVASGVVQKNAAYAVFNFFISILNLYK